MNKKSFTLSHNLLTLLTYSNALLFTGIGTFRDNILQYQQNLKAPCGGAPMTIKKSSELVQTEGEVQCYLNQCLNMQYKIKL